MNDNNDQPTPVYNEEIDDGDAVVKNDDIMRMLIVTQMSLTRSSFQPDPPQVTRRPVTPATTR